MATLPTFKTERLLLRPRSMVDMADCIAMDRDPSVTRYIPGPWADPPKHREFLTARMTTIYPVGLGYWSVLSRANPSEFLGWIMLLPISDMHNQAEIGWRFNRRSWGHGYATESALLILTHALQTLKLTSVTAYIVPENVGSLRVAEKLGMRPINEKAIAAEQIVTCQITETALQTYESN